jgi:hypothetical protein
MNLAVSGRQFQHSVLFFLPQSPQRFFTGNTRLNEKTSQSEAQSFCPSYEYRIVIVPLCEKSLWALW